MTVISEILLGLVVAAAFDWGCLYLLNVGGHPTQKLRHQAALAAFSLHGPFFALALPLWVNGRLMQLVLDQGVLDTAAPFIAMVALGALMFAAFWLAGRIPIVASARAAVELANESRVGGRGFGFLGKRVK